MIIEWNDITFFGLAKQLKQTIAMAWEVKDQLQVKAFKNILERPRWSLPPFLIQQFSRNAYNSTYMPGIGEVVLLR